MRLFPSNSSGIFGDPRRMRFGQFRLMRRVAPVVAVLCSFATVDCFPKPGDIITEPEVPDRTPPTVTDITPAPSATAPRNVNEFSFTTTDPAGANGSTVSGVNPAAVTATLGNGANIPLSRSGNTYSGSLNGVADGALGVTIKTADGAGNLYSETFTLRVDRTPPAVSITEAPQSGQNLTSPSFDFKWSGVVSDANPGVSAAYVYRTGSDNVCGTADDVLWEVGPGTGYMSKSTFDAITGPLGNGSFSTSYTGSNPVQTGGTPQPTTQCFVLVAADFALDALGTPKANVTRTVRTLQFIWAPPPPTTGSIIGVVTVAGVGQAGVTVTVAGKTVVTAGNGAYSVLNVNEGIFPVNISGIPTGAVCTPTSGTAIVLAGQISIVNFDCVYPFGVVSGVVYAGEDPLVGVPVKMGTRVTTTDADGEYSFANVPVGPVVVGVDVSGYDGDLYECDFSTQAVVVVGGKNVHADFSCAFRPGVLLGSVKRDGLPLEGVRVTLSNGDFDITGADGLYFFTELGPGTYTVNLSQLPQGTVCAPVAPLAIVVRLQTTTRDFTCISSALFQVAVLTSYLHFSTFSQLCATIQTTPAQPNAAFQASVTGPGVSGSGTWTGTLDANGRALVRQTILLYGLYNWLVTVGNRTASATSNVTATTGTCSP